jgi:site-specific DNA-methyltransferase (adenine-specific)
MSGAPGYYAKGEQWAVYLGDSRDIIPTFPRDKVHLLVTDPPYGQGWISGRRKAEALPTKVVRNDLPEDVSGVKEVLLESLRVLSEARHVYVFGPTSLIEGFPLGGITQLVWDKGQMGLGDLRSPWALSHEYISFGVMTASAANRRDGYGNLAARMRKETVLRMKRKNSRGVRRHPTEKPVDLLREFVESSSRIGEIVFDPFMGSGSTLVAAVLEKRRAIGIDIEEKYVAMAAERLTAIESWMKGCPD